MIFPRLIEQPALGNPVKIDQGGDAVDDFLYYGDLAQALVRCCFAAGPLLPFYHVGSGQGLQLKDLAKAVLNRLPEAQIEIGPGPAFIPRPPNYHCVLDFSAARRDFGYEPGSPQEWVDSFLARTNGR